MYWDGDGFVIFTNDYNVALLIFLANDTISRERKRAKLALILEAVKLKDYKERKRCLLAKIIGESSNNPCDCLMWGGFPYLLMVYQAIDLRAFSTRIVIKADHICIITVF